MKTAHAFHIYLLGNLDQFGFTKLLAALGLEAEPLIDPAQVVRPALIVVGPDRQAPEGLDDITIKPPPDASPAALRELLRMAMENAALKVEVTQLEEQAKRQHRQFEELNRIGIALSAEKDIAKLQNFILMTMRQLTNADGASLWLTAVGDSGEPMLFLSASQNTSIANTYSAFKVPVNDKSVVGYT